MPEAHRPHDVAEVVPREELLLLRVKQVKADLDSSRVASELWWKKQEQSIKHHQLRKISKMNIKKQNKDQTSQENQIIPSVSQENIKYWRSEWKYWDGQNCFHNCLSHLKTLDLIVGKIGLFIDLLKVNVSVGICLTWIKTDVFKSCEFALFHFYNVTSCCCCSWNQTLLFLGIEIDKVSSCLTSPAMIFGWGEFSEVKVKRDWAGGRGGFVEEESCLTVFHRRHNTHNLTIQSLTVFSPHPHVCHANHIAALVRCLVQYIQYLCRQMLSDFNQHLSRADSKEHVKHWNMAVTRNYIVIQTACQIGKY